VLDLPPTSLSRRAEVTILAFVSPREAQGEPDAVLAQACAAKLGKARGTPMNTDIHDPLGRRIVHVLSTVAATLVALPANATDNPESSNAAAPQIAAAPATPPVTASLETTPPGATEPGPPNELPTPGEAPPPPPAPSSPSYSLPWQLRPVTVGNVVRSDTNFARYENTAAQGGFTVASTLVASFKIPGTGGPGQGLAPLVRLAAVNDSPPTGNGGLAVVNPLVGAMYAIRIAGPIRAAAFLGMTVPVGMGGGNTPQAGLVDARNKGIPAREAMDNSLFAVNDLAVIPGVGIGYIDRGFTVQGEATLFQLQRVRGEAVQPEANKTNFTCGLHAGWFATPMLSFGVDVHYQRWLNGPIAVDKDPALVDNFSVAFGPRFHVPLGGKTAVHPGVAYARGVDKPMAAPNYHIVQLDVPVTF
jgi:hypothetical protein